ncbi:MAG: hypothetical protein PVJ57_06660 [Phycisphaerae bacterium]|jgi:hypothetical protein
MRAEQWRKLVFGVLVVALGAWYGLTQWPPATSSATPAGPAVALDDELGSLVAADGCSTDDAAPVGDSLAEIVAQVTDWPADPFYRAASPAEDYTVPTEPVVSEVPTTCAYTLTGIIAGDNPLAMLNGRPVGLGDVLADGVTVIAIDDTSVTIREPGGTYTVKLPD